MAFGSDLDGLEDRGLWTQQPLYGEGGKQVALEPPPPPPPVWSNTPNWDASAVQDHHWWTGLLAVPGTPVVYPFHPLAGLTSQGVHVRQPAPGAAAPPYQSFTCPTNSRAPPAYMRRGYTPG